MTKDGLSVKRITYEDTKSFILKIHYARRMPCIQYAFGLFDGDYPDPVGIVTFGQPATPAIGKGMAGDENRRNVLELNRLVLYPEYNGENYASYLVAKALKMLPNGTFVVSYADWGGVASCRVRVPGNQLVIHGHDQAKDRYTVFERTTRTALREGGNSTADQDGEAPIRVSGRRQADGEEDAISAEMEGVRQVPEGKV